MVDVSWTLIEPLIDTINWLNGRENSFLIEVVRTVDSSLLGLIFVEDSFHLDSSSRRLFSDHDQQLGTVLSFLRVAEKL